jgi:hypothetical protein
MEYSVLRMDILNKAVSHKDAEIQRKAFNQVLIPKDLFRFSPCPLRLRERTGLEAFSHGGTETQRKVRAEIPVLTIKYFLLDFLRILCASAREWVGQASTREAAKK